MCFEKASMVVMKAVQGRVFLRICARARVCTGNVGRWNHCSSLRVRGEGRCSETLHRGRLGDRGVQGAQDFCLTPRVPFKNAQYTVLFSFHSEQ